MNGLPVLSEVDGPRLDAKALGTHLGRQRGSVSMKGRVTQHVRLRSELDSPDARGLSRHPRLPRTNLVHVPGIVILGKLAGAGELAVVVRSSLFREAGIAGVSITLRSQQGKVAETVGACGPLLLVELIPVIAGSFRQHVLDVVSGAFEIEAASG